MAMALDTLAYAQRLRESGFSEQQAEGQARALAAAMTETLATKQDLQELEARVAVRFAQVDVRIDGLETHVDTRLAELERRLEIRLEEQEKRLGIRFEEQEKRLGIRFAELRAHFGGQLADVERRMTLRLGSLMILGMSALATLIKLL